MSTHVEQLWFMLLCPFCASGNAPRLEKVENLIAQTIVHRVACRNCGAKGPDRELPEIAVFAWNKRYYPQSPGHKLIAGALPSESEFRSE